MKAIFIYFSFIAFIGCSNPSQKPTHKNVSNKVLPDSTIKKYKEILDVLSHDYLFYYRANKVIGEDVTAWGMPDSDSAFKIDSLKYWEHYRLFIDQDSNFVDWLLGFKYDTANFGLWSKYLNPLSSQIGGECHLRLSNSRAAIILLENFLIGYNEKGIIECFECAHINHQKCNADKYVQIETFLLNNKGKSIEEIREVWRSENHR